MAHFSDSIERLEASATLEMARLVRERQRAKKPVFSLTLGEPDFETPEHIQQAALAAMRAGYTHYPPLNGYPELREAAATFLNRYRPVSYEAEHLFVTVGAKQAIIHALLAILNPGDRVLLLAPYWVSYKSMVEFARAVPVIYQTKAQHEYKITPDALDALLEKAPFKCVIFNSPSNPTGSVYTKAEILQLLEVLKRYPDVWILSDEIYDLLVYEGDFTSFALDEAISDRLILVHGASKLFAMTGWRIGILATRNRKLLDLVSRIQGVFTSGACSISQRAAIAAYSGPLEPLFRMRDQFAYRLSLACDLLAAHLPTFPFVKPKGAFYIYLDVSPALGKRSPGGQTLLTPDDLVLTLLEETGVAVVSGTGFGTNHHIRISCATDPQTLQQGLERMIHFFQQLQ
jgi:aspartate aminotransferase